MKQTSKQATKRIWSCTGLDQESSSGNTEDRSCFRFWIWWAETCRCIFVNSYHNGAQSQLSQTQARNIQRSNSGQISIIFTRTSHWRKSLYIVYNLSWTRANITARCRAVALETTQDNLSWLLAPVQVLIAVFLHTLHVCAPDEMGAPIQVTAFRQRDVGGAISDWLWCLWTCISFQRRSPAAEWHAAAAVFDIGLSYLFLFMDTSWLAFKRTQSVKAIAASPH